MSTYSDHDQRQMDIASGLEMDRRRAGRAILSIDGNAGCALLGSDLHAGEAEFVTIEQREDEPLHEAETRACWAAFNALKTRLNKPDLSYVWYPRRPGFAGF